MSSDSEGFESAGEDIDGIETLAVFNLNVPSKKNLDINLTAERHGIKTVASSPKSHVTDEFKSSQIFGSSIDSVFEESRSSGLKPEHNPRDDEQPSASKKHEDSTKSSNRNYQPNESRKKIDEVVGKLENRDEKNDSSQLGKGDKDFNDEDWPGDWGDESNIQGWEVEEEDGFEIPQKLGSNIKTILVERSIIEDADSETSTSDQPIKASEAPKSDTPVEVTTKPSGWGGWGWGVTSLLSTASEGVQTLTQQVTSVSSGITSAIGGGIEGLLDAPNPEELARMSAKEKAEVEETQNNPSSGVPDLFGITNLLGGVSQLGSKVISGGLDTLENLGKKTMEVLQEGDPGLKKKRALLFQVEKPILSQVLREAKERNESEEKENKEDESLRKVQYETLFDDFHGLVHLEALEMISRQCEIKVQDILTEGEGEEDEETSKDNKETLESVKELCELPEVDDEETITPDELRSRLESAMESLAVNVLFDKLLTVDFDSESCSSKSGIEIHEEAITKVAKLTALCMEFLHRIAESLMISDLSSPSTGSEALIAITMAAKYRVSSIAEDYCTCLTKMDPMVNSPLVTNIYLEASNSNNYLGNAFDLFVPVLQLGALS